MRIIRKKLATGKRIKVCQLFSLGHGKTRLKRLSFFQILKLGLGLKKLVKNSKFE